MAKQRKEDAPPPGSPAWMATFGDLMNLLLCFFVLLFSMSTVDAEKFEQIVASFSESFSILPRGASAIGDGLLISNGVSQLNELSQHISSMGQAAEDTESDEMMEEVSQMQLEKSEDLAEKIEETLKEEKLDKDIDIDFTSQYVMLTLNGALLFESGNASVRPESVQLLQKVGYILQRYAESEIEIEGHTDNVPINTAKYANNNELSSARALSVFDFIIQSTSLDPAMLKHSGRGEYMPIADNSIAEGRAQNRRVEIKIYHTLSTYK